MCPYLQWYHAMHISLQANHGHVSSKGKGTTDPVKFLPVLPSKRQKPAWQVNPPSFFLNGNLDDHDRQDNGIDMVAELTARKLIQ